MAELMVFLVFMLRPTLSFDFDLEDFSCASLFSLMKHATFNFCSFIGKQALCCLLMDMLGSCIFL